MTNKQTQLDFYRRYGEGEARRSVGILEAKPDWATLESKGSIPKGTSSTLSLLHGYLTADLSQILADPSVLHLLVKVLNVNILHPVQYVCGMLYEVVRDDASSYDVILDTLGVEETRVAFQDVASKSTDSYCCDKATYILTGVISRAPTDSFAMSTVQEIINLMLTKYRMSDVGLLQSICNLLKLDRYRAYVWGRSNFPNLLLKSLEAKPTTYMAVFAIWLFSMNQTFWDGLRETGLVRKLCSTLKEVRTEKVIRLAVQVVKRIAVDNECAEILIEENVVHTVTILEYEKWRDEELYAEFHEALNILHAKTRQLSNFSRYCRQLEKGHLTWGHLHSEKFWHENVMHFEENEFDAIKKLSVLLTSTDSVTAAVACHDVGEFARLHPTGKTIIQRLGIKDKAMLLLGSKDRVVCREALLCIQKLMLDNWRELTAAH